MREGSFIFGQILSTLFRFQARAVRHCLSQQAAVGIGSRA